MRGLNTLLMMNLEPYIDGRTMEIHYSKHHLGYAKQIKQLLN